jgi:hypothetical protein
MVQTILSDVEWREERHKSKSAEDNVKSPGTYANFAVREVKFRKVKESRALVRMILAPLIELTDATSAARLLWYVLSEAECRRR